MNQPETPSRVSRTRWRWLTCFALLLLLASLRLPWLAADSGNSVFWSFAYFSYDEAAYTSGGRLASLTGRFLDPDLSEPHTFGSGWGMHFLAYLGYRLDGLTLGAMRWPSLVLAIAAWLAVYRLLCRRTPPLLAGLLVALVSCNPVSLTYERTASTDVAVAALTILAFALVTARRPVWSVGAGAFVALACCIKANAVVLIPLVALGGWTAPRHRGRRLTVLG
ncbi:glycosyltransferase family 39 protein, partial [bacterium]|nr:glycosyltransferase family 39 protein [bacterium]